MAHGFTRWGHEWLVKYAFTDEVERPATMEVLLYNDAEDDIQNDDDIEDITTEPAITRDTVGFGDDLYTNLAAHLTQWRVDEHAEFDASGVDDDVDSWALVWEATLAKDIHAAWGEGSDDWEDDYVWDGPQPWEEDQEFDEDAVAPVDHLMIRGPLEDPEDLSEWQTFTVGVRSEVHGLF